MIIRLFKIGLHQHLKDMHLVNQEFIIITCEIKHIEYLKGPISILAIRNTCTIVERLQNIGMCSKYR